MCIGLGLVIAKYIDAGKTPSQYRNEKKEEYNNKMENLFKYDRDAFYYEEQKRKNKEFVSYFR